MAEPGDVGVMLPSGGHYIIHELSVPSEGDRALLFPMPGGENSILKLTSSVEVGENVTIVPDGKGNYYAIE